MRRERLPYRYDHYTWIEIRDLVARTPQPVVLLPVGSVEDHGPHLPLDVDHFLISEICEEAARRAGGDILLLPTVCYGFETHHMDFPGTIDVRPRHLEDFMVDITTSVAHHGFRRILIANGHGSNMPVLALAARRTVLESPALCAAFMWTSLIPEVLAEIRETDRGGMAHACELETSVYLYLNETGVQKDKAERDYSEYASEFHWQDLALGAKVHFMDWWSRISRKGVVGDPTRATAEKGRQAFEAAVEAVVRLAREFQRWPDRSRRDLHRETL